MPYWCRSLHKKSLSDGNIIGESKSPTSTSNIGKRFACSSMIDPSPGGSNMVSESTPEISACENGFTYSRCVYVFQLFFLKYLLWWTQFWFKACILPMWSNCRCFHFMLNFVPKSLYSLLVIFTQININCIKFGHHWGYVRI